MVRIAYYRNFPTERLITVKPSLRKNKQGHVSVMIYDARKQRIAFANLT
jgi:hypothetical protein